MFNLKESFISDESYEYEKRFGPDSNLSTMCQVVSHTKHIQFIHVKYLRIHFILPFIWHPVE